MSGGPLVSSLFSKTGGPLVLFWMKIIGYLMHHVTVLKYRVGHWKNFDALIWNFNALKDNFGAWWRHRRGCLPGNHHQTYHSKTLKTLNTEFRAAKKSKKIVILWEFKAFVKKLWFESIGHIRGNKAIRFAAIKRNIFVKWWLFFQMFYFCLSIIILFSILKMFTDLFQNSLMQNICKSKLNKGWYENRTSPGKICDSKANIQL